METYFLMTALGIGTAAAVADIRTGRIPNWLTYGGLIGAFLARWFVLGWRGEQSALLGMATAGGIFLLLFLVGGMGGGDVKLMAAIGAWVGITLAWDVLIATAVAGGAMAIGVAVVRGQVRQTLANTAELVRHHMASGLQPHPSMNIREPGSLRVPFGLAIALGTLYCLGRLIVGR